MYKSVDISKTVNWLQDNEVPEFVKDDIINLLKIIHQFFDKDTSLVNFLERIELRDDLPQNIRELIQNEYTTVDEFYKNLLGTIKVDADILGLILSLESRINKK